MNNSDLVKLVRAVGECFVGLNLIEADQVLDQARRMAYWRRFSGDDFPSLGGSFQPSKAALEAAAILVGLSIVDGEKVAFEVRSHMWTMTFARIPESSFSQQLRCHAADQAGKVPRKRAARRARKKKPPKLTVIPGGRIN